MKHRDLFLLLSASAMAMAFTLPGEPKETTSPTGTYGVCGCEPANTVSSIGLVLNEDHSFRYFEGNTEERGAWQLNGRTITLNTDPSGAATTRTWTMDKDQPCLRSRQGFTFTRLCHLEKCE